MMIQFIEAARCLFLGFLLIAIGLAPDSLQPLSDVIFDFAGRIAPVFSDFRPRIQSQPSWGLVALGGAIVAATFVAYLRR
jgi:hypothetical protein